ncbi:alginate O-acetyltransferase AlgX-related protein [Flavicella sediminum]|uniref:alginate O-acetyltransferase AlgX-related protein n=1 Tax=Flavicella sediminum TaxID=2585141 RepID=UPI00111E0D07|nr:hypothetical protein [Flavicella sediminum]
MKGKIALIFCFIFMLLVPTILMFTDVEKKYKQNENRKLVSLKMGSLRDVKRSIIDLKSFYTDNFGTRFLLYNFYNEYVSNIFNETPSVHKVLFGKEGWLFLGNNYHQAFSQVKGEVVFTKDEVYTIKNNLEAAENWSVQNKIQFYVSVVPGKHSIYTEYLPYKIHKQKTKLDQIVEAYPNLIDLRSTLKAKKQQQLYFKTDTHWNEIGAFEGYLKIMEQIKVNNHNMLLLTKESIDTITYNSKRIGDIGKILNKEMEEIAPKISLKNELGRKAEKNLEVPFYHRLEKNNYEFRYLNEGALNNLKIVVLRDSYSDFLINYFRATFSEVVFIYNHQFDKKLLLKENPDIVLYEMGERVTKRFMTIHTIE